MEITKLYVGNLNYSVDENKLQEIFSSYGTVKSASLITDRDTGRSKGFAFIEMSSKSEAEAAIAALNEKDLNGRNIKVNEARPKTEGGGGGYGRGRGGGGGGRRY